MKVSYKVLQKYIPNIKSVEEVAQDLIMHTAEVEEIIHEGEHLKDVYIGKVLTCKKHPDSDKLNCTTVEVNGKTLEIVCGAPNVKVWMIVPVAIVGAKLAPDFEIKKTKIRGETSEGMICSEDELGLIEERQEGILELPENAPLGISMREYLKKNDSILEIDNKAINHRPDLFSHIGVAREVSAINGDTLNYTYSCGDYTSLPKLEIKNDIPKLVSRYKGLKIENVDNIDSPEYIKQVLGSAETGSKGLLIDISNYSLYLYGQPTHCFDADKVKWDIVIRKAKAWEKFLALNDSEYELSSDDIVISDDNGVIALGGIIGGKYSAVSNSTTSIIVESAHFDQAIIRKSGKRLGIRTDALNVFEKDLVNEIQHAGMSLIADELQKNIPTAKLSAYTDLYPEKQQQVTIEFDLNFINNLIGKDYSEKQVVSILQTLGISKKENTLIIPFWRKDLTNGADIAEEIARIDGYDKIPSTVPRINLGAVIQDPIYTLKNDTRNFFTNKGFFDIYNYSFVNEGLMKKTLWDTKNLIPIKNALSEDLTHMKGSHIPGLLESVEKNSRDFENLQLIEIEKVFSKWDSKIEEHNAISGIIISEKDVLYYEIQSLISDLLNILGVTEYSFDVRESLPSYAHKGRSAHIIIRNQIVGIIGEIHPKVVKNFDLSGKVGFFEINTKHLSSALYNMTKAKEISEFQENNFDISFVVDKTIKGRDIKQAIEKTDTNIIKKVELFDIYEDAQKLPGKRSLSFTVYISSMTQTLDDTIKNKLISEIILKVEKKWGVLR